MGLFDPTTPPNVETSRVTAAQAPQYLTDYLTDLAAKGRQQLGASGESLVAGPSALQQQAYGMAPGVATAYQPAMNAAFAAGQAGAAPITSADISAFYNPYQQQVIDEMSRQSALNVQRNLMPQLKSAFVGAGSLGSQRYADAAGQTLADIQANLLGEQSKYRAMGFQSALDAALKQKTGQTSAAATLGGIGSSTETAATSGLKSLTDLGAQQQAYEQAKIEAPTVRAQNIAQILRGYTYPTTTTETYKGPASSYGPSPLSQIAGLGALLGSGFSSSSGWGNKFIDWINKMGTDGGQYKNWTDMPGWDTDWGTP